MSGSLLSTHGFRMVIEADKLILSKAGMFVGKGYALEGLFKLNVMAVKAMNNNKTPIAYLVESLSTWYSRLGHVNFDSIKRMVKLEYISQTNHDPNYKCQTYVEAKATRASFGTIVRDSKPLELFHIAHVSMNKFKWFAISHNCTK